MLNALPSTGHWRNKTISAYTVDPWFLDQANLMDFSLDKGLWYIVGGRVVIPDSGDIRLKLISDFHSCPYVGHVGINQTTRLILRYYWWQNMDQDIACYVRECHSCQTIKVDLQAC